MPSKGFHDAFDRLAAAERRFLGSEFLAPVLAGDHVLVRVAGVVCRMQVKADGLEGLGVFRPTSQRDAELVRPAGLAERARYLRLFPMVRFILCARDGRDWLGTAAHAGDRRFQIDGLVPIRMVEEAEPFDTVQTRFDGRAFWFDSVDMKYDPAAAAYLREQLNRLTDPEQLERSGLSREQRTAYAMNYLAEEEVRKQREIEQTEARIRVALGHAGAQLVGYLERRDGFRVTYKIDGQRHVTAVDKRDLSVQVAGICLSGRDHDFDLSSLVGVIRQADHGGDIYRVGPEGMDEDEYWQVHPPENR